MIQKIYKDKINNSFLNLFKKKVNNIRIDWNINKFSNMWNEIKERERIVATIKKIKK